MNKGGNWIVTLNNHYAIYRLKFSIYVFVFNPRIDIGYLQDTRLDCFRCFVTVGLNSLFGERIFIERNLLWMRFLRHAPAATTLHCDTVWSTHIFSINKIFTSFIRLSLIQKQFKNSNVSMLQVKVCTCRGRLNIVMTTMSKQRASCRWKYV